MFPLHLLLTGTIHPDRPMHQPVHRTLDLLQFLDVPEEQQRVEVAVADVPDDGARKTLLLQVSLRLVDEMRESGYGDAVGGLVQQVGGKSARTNIQSECERMVAKGGGRGRKDVPNIRRPAPRAWMCAERGDQRVLAVLPQGIRLLIRLGELKPRSGD